MFLHLLSMSSQFCLKRNLERYASIPILYSPLLHDKLLQDFCILAISLWMRMCDEENEKLILFTFISSDFKKHVHFIHLDTCDIIIYFAYTYMPSGGLSLFSRPRKGNDVFCLPSPCKIYHITIFKRTFAFPFFENFQLNILFICVFPFNVNYQCVWYGVELLMW